MRICMVVITHDLLDTLCAMNVLLKAFVSLLERL